MKLKTTENDIKNINKYKSIFSIKLESFSFFFLSYSKILYFGVLTSLF